MRYNILFGGKAGQGPNILTQILGDVLVKAGYFVFYSRDYQSLIRGGHNFNVLTFSNEPVNSNDSKLDIIIALDDNTEKSHKSELKKDGIILSDGKENMHFAGRIFKILGLDFSVLERELKELKNFEENVKNAREGYGNEKGRLNLLKPKKSRLYFMNGSKGISDGAIKSGLDIYYAYPMTPATSVLNELAEKQYENNFLVLELENEISVVIAAIGSSITGAKSMVGTSGGGFDLMTEALSMCGMAEIPLVIYLAQRPGPSTGVPTYTGQGDLHMARHAGHGEFQRILISPGDPRDALELVSHAFYFSQKYKIPCIVLGDKHFAESFYTFEEKFKIVRSGKLTKLGRYNSYEADKDGIASDAPEIIKKNVERRAKKYEILKKEAEKFEMFKIFGNKNSKNLIVSYGSTKGAIIDAINELDIKFLQILYIEPFSSKIKKELEKAKKIMLVENNATGMLADVIAEKTGLLIKDKILRYDGRPFLADELKEEIRKGIR